MSDLAETNDPTLPLERIAAIEEPIARTSSALEAAAHWKREAEHWKSIVDRLEEQVLNDIPEKVRMRQLIALFASRVPAPVADRWTFSRDEQNAAPTRHLRITPAKDGSVHVEL